MPFSDEEGKPWLDSAFERVVLAANASGRTRRVLDVGAGCGTYVDRWRGMTYAPTWWTGVEVHRPYVTEYRLHEKYDALILADVRTAVEHLGRHDVVILGDVLEHMPLEHAAALWRVLRRRARHLLVSLPIIPMEQGAWGGNEHERHLTTWDHAMVLAQLPGITAWEVGERIGVYQAVGA